MLYSSCGLEKTNSGWKGYLSYKDVEGKWRKKKKTFKTKYKRDAQKMLNQWRDQEEEKAKREIKFTTVERAVRDYVTAQYTLGQITTVTYQRDMRQAEYAIYPYIGDESFYDISTETLQKWINDLSAKYKASSVTNFYAIFGKAYRNALRQGKIIRDARAGLILPKKKGKHEIAYLDRDGRAKLISLISDGEVVNSFSNDLYIPILLAYYGGLRAEEVCALQWKDVNYATNTIYIDKASKQIKDSEGKNIVVIEATKTYSVRTVPIMPQLKEALQRQEELDNPKAKDYICAWRNPRHLGSAFQKWAKRNELISVLEKPITFHGLRHTFATMAVQSKMDIKSLASILGHKDATMTLNIYASDDEQAKQYNIQNLAAMLQDEMDSDF